MVSVRFLINLILNLFTVLGVLHLSFILVSIVFLDVVSIQQFLFSFFLFINNLPFFNFPLKSIDFFGYNEILMITYIVITGLIIAFPLFLMSLYFMVKLEMDDPTIVQNKFRRLFFIISLIVFTLILVIYSFLFLSIFSLTQIVWLILSYLILLPNIIFALKFLNHTFIKK